MSLSKYIIELIHQIKNRHPGGVSLGPVQDDVFKALQERNPAFTTPEYVVNANDVIHLQRSRMEKPNKAKDRMTPDQIGDLVNSLTTSTRSKVITTKKEHPQGLLVPHGERTFIGVLEPENGNVGLYTAYAPETKKLPKKLDSIFPDKTTYKDWVDANLPSNYAPRDGGREFTQRQLSAVESLYETNDTDIDKKVKSLLPYFFGGGAAGAAALASPEDAEAVNIGPRGYINLFGKPLNESTQGAFKGAEGMLRYELPDNGMRLTPEFETAWGQSDSAFPAMSFLGNAIEHPDLFKAYPQLGDMDLSAWRTPQGVSGAAYHDSIDAKAPNVPSLLDTITHEYQHGVQGLEGMAVGGSPAMFSGSANPRGEYLRLAGETEARDVASRRTMTPEQRQAQPQTWQNRDDLIVSQPGEGATQQDGRTRLGAFLGSAGIDDSMQRNFGLGTRDVMEGLTSLPDGVSNAVNSAFGGSGDYFRLGGTLSDWMGLPKEQNQGLSSSIIQSVAGGLPVVPVGLAMQGAGKLPMLGNALASYGKTDLGVDIGLGAALSNPAMRWAFGR